MTIPGADIFIPARITIQKANKKSGGSGRVVDCCPITSKFDILLLHKYNIQGVPRVKVTTSGECSLC